MREQELKKYLSFRVWKEADVEVIVGLLKPYLRGYTENITGDAAICDEVVYVRESWGGSYKRPSFEGYIIEKGTIVKESYGAAKQQHTFTIQLDSGKKTMIKGRNLYKVITLAKKRDVAERESVLEEKHARGDVARVKREYRKFLANTL